MSRANLALNYCSSECKEGNKIIAKLHWQFVIWVQILARITESDTWFTFEGRKKWCGRPDLPPGPWVWYQCSNCSNYTDLLSILKHRSKVVSICERLNISSSQVGTLIYSETLCWEVDLSIIRTGSDMPNVKKGNSNALSFGNCCSTQRVSNKNVTERSVVFVENARAQKWSHLNFCGGLSLAYTV